MKKTILFLLCISMVFSLPSCTFPYFDRVMSDLTSTPTTQTTTQDHFTTGGKEPVNRVWIDTYSEYEEFLANYTDIPSDFVHFEEIEELGTFKGFIRHRNFSSDEFGLENMPTLSPVVHLIGYLNVAPGSVPTNITTTTIVVD